MSDRLPAFGLPRCSSKVWRPASRLLAASDASTPVEFSEERGPQFDELAARVIQHRENSLAVIGRECNEVPGECDSVQQDASSVIGTVAREHRREFECVPARNAGAGDNRHGREILRDCRVHTWSMANPTPPGAEGETFYGQPMIGRPVGQVLGVL